MYSNQRIVEIGEGRLSNLHLLKVVRDRLLYEKDSGANRLELGLAIKSLENSIGWLERLDPNNPLT